MHNHTGRRILGPHCLTLEDACDLCAWDRTAVLQINDAGGVHLSTEAQLRSKASVAFSRQQR